MIILAFDIAEINRVIKPEMMAKDSVFYPTTEHVFDGANYPGGMVLNAEGLTRQQCSEETHFHPDHTKMKAVPKALVIANDKGFYIHANVKSDMNPIRRGTAVWAKGYNPIVDDNWERSTRNVYNGALSITIEIKELVEAIKSQQEYLTIDLSERLASGRAA